MMSAGLGLQIVNKTVLRVKDFKLILPGMNVLKWSPKFCLHIADNLQPL